MNLVSEFSRSCALKLGSRFFIVAAVSVGLLYAESSARADGPEGQGGRSAIVKIRAIRASGMDDGVKKADDPSAEASAAGGAAKPASGQAIDEGLDDISSKLKNLRYKHFKLVCNQQVEVPLMKKRTVYLAEGNSLTVRPLYIDEDKVGLWLRWLDGAGMRVLDTRVHLHDGESVITGTDGLPEPESNAETGMVLAIEVRPSGR